MKKSICILMILSMLFALAACGAPSQPAVAPTETAPVETSAPTPEPVVLGTVTYYNDDPALEQAWESLAALYGAQTGVEVKVVSPAAGTYEQQLAADLDGAAAPTLFVLSGYKQLASFRDKCYDLSGSEAAAQLFSDRFALRDGGAVLGLAYSLETYGLITNQTLLDAAGYTVDNINCFEDLKKVAEVITRRSQKLGFAAFSSAGLDSSSEARFNTVLANLPLYYETLESGSPLPETIRGTYLDNYRAIWDLYLNNSTCKSAEIPGKTAEDSRNEFLAGKAVFYQSSADDYENLKDSFAEGELTMMPIYFGVGDEEYQGLCTGSQHYWCVSAAASELDREATLDFLTWLTTAPEALTVLANEMRLELPFRGAPESVNPCERANRTMIELGLEPVTLCFELIPSENWKINLSAALAGYAAGSSDWDRVVSCFTGAPVGVSEEGESAAPAETAAAN